MTPLKAKFAINPCPPGKWPWVGTDGVSKCLYHDSTVENCQNIIFEENGHLECEIIALKSVVPILKQNCGRRRRWQYGRCVRLFNKHVTTLNRECRKQLDGPLALATSALTTELQEATEFCLHTTTSTPPATNF